MKRFSPGFLFLATVFSPVAPAIAAGDVEIGAPAPEFELPDQDGQLHSLEDYRDQWVVLYFYPKDETPGCTTQACEFRDNIFAFRKLNAQILGVSLDNVESHKKFSLLADPEGTTADAYGVKTRMMGWTVAKRQTFIVDPEGNVARHYEKVDPDRHAAEVLADLEALGASAAP